MSFYGCHQYLMDNGYEHEESVTTLADGGLPEELDSWTKSFDGYYIRITQHTNEWGGKEIIEIVVDPNKKLGEATKPYHSLRAPHISFFATGYHDYKAMEEKAPAIVKMLESWAIEVL